MKKIVKYNKLIRDKIPEIIKNDGWIPILKTLNKKEFLIALQKKVAEEAGELIKAKNRKGISEEIVDIQEILDAITSEIGSTKSEIKNQQKIKNKKRGAFKKRLFLIREEKQ